MLETIVLELDGVLEVVPEAVLECALETKELTE